MPSLQCQYKSLGYLVLLFVQQAHIDIGGITKWEAEGAVAHIHSRQGGAKQPHQKYFVTNDQKIEFDKACLMIQQQSIATNFCYFDCQLVYALVTLLHRVGGVAHPWWYI